MEEARLQGREGFVEGIVSLIPLFLFEVGLMWLV